MTHLRLVDGDNQNGGDLPPSPPGPPVNHGAVKHLEQLLERTRAGELRSFLIVMLGPDGRTYQGQSVIGDMDFLVLLGESEVHRLAITAYLNQKRQATKADL